MLWICATTCTQATHLSMAQRLSWMEILLPIFSLCKICHLILGKHVFLKIKRMHLWNYLMLSVGYRRGTRTWLSLNT